MTSQTTNDIRRTVGRNIKAARLARQWTQRELAERVNGVDTLAVSRWERGRAMPNRDNLQALGEILKCDVADLFELERAA